MASTVENPMQLDLTAEFLTALGHSPIIAGDTLDLRFQVRDDADAAVDLTGAAIVHSWRKREADAAALFQRTTDDDVPTMVGTKQIAIDADQTTETGDTGKGWYTIRYRPADETTMVAAEQAKLYDTRIEFSDGSVRTHTRGRIACLKPRSLGSEIP